MDKTDRLRDYGLAFLLYKQGLSVCGYELIRELFIFIKLILNSYLELLLFLISAVSIKAQIMDTGHKVILYLQDKESPLGLMRLNGCA